MMKNRKVVITVVLIVATILFAGLAIFLVWAINNRNVSPNDTNAAVPEVNLSGIVYCTKEENGGISQVPLSGISIAFTTSSGQTIDNTMSQSDGTWSAAVNLDSLLNGNVKVIPNNTYQYAGVPDSTSGATTGVSCTNSNINGFQLDPSGQYISEQNGCKRTIQTTNVNFNVGTCKSVTTATTTPTSTVTSSPKSTPTPTSTATRVPVATVTPTPTITSTPTTTIAQTTATPTATATSIFTVTTTITATNSPLPNTGIKDQIGIFIFGVITVSLSTGIFVLYKRRFEDRIIND